MNKANSFLLTVDAINSFFTKSEKTIHVNSVLPVLMLAFIYEKTLF